MASISLGIDAEVFWDRTIGETLDVLTKHEEQEIAKAKQKYREIFLLAKLVSADIGASLNGDSPVEVWDVFPELFEKDKEEYEKALLKQQLSVYTANFINYANWHNEMRHTSGGDTVGTGRDIS